MNIKISDISDRFLGVLTVFFTACFILNFLINDKPTLYSASVALAFSLVALPIKLRERKQKPRDYSYLLPRFYYKTSREVAEYFLEFFRKKYDCKLSGCKIVTEKFDVCFYLKPDALSANAAIAYSLAAKKKTLLVASSLSDNAAFHAENAGNNLKIIEFGTFCGLIEKLGHLPEADKPSFFKRLAAFFDWTIHAENCKRLVPAAGFMLALSYINGFSVWFLCFAALLLAMSVAALVRGKSNKNV